MPTPTSGHRNWHGKSLTEYTVKVLQFQVNFIDRYFDCTETNSLIAPSSSRPTFSFSCLGCVLQMRWNSLNERP